MHRLIVMGVSGCGKSTLAAQLSATLGYPMIEGDAHHLPKSQEKMRRGIALDDSDREPWLDRLGDLVAAHAGGVVLSCSALKRSYRERLRARVSGLKFIYIDIDEKQAIERVRARPEHLFPDSLVLSQFEVLESPIDEPRVLAVPGTLPPHSQVDAVMHWLRAPQTTPN